MAVPYSTRKVSTKTENRTRYITYPTSYLNTDMKTPLTLARLPVSAAGYLDIATIGPIEGAPAVSVVNSGTTAVWDSTAVWGSSVFGNRNTAEWGCTAVWGSTAVWDSTAFWGPTAGPAAESVPIAICGGN